MKKVDIKSFLIGVLITTNLFFFMGFSSTTKSVELYDNDDIMREVKRIKSTVSSIKSTVSYIDLSSIESDVSSIESTVSYIESTVSSIESDMIIMKIYGIDCNE